MLTMSLNCQFNNLESEYMDAIDANDIERIKELLYICPNIDRKYIIQYACELGHLDIELYDNIDYNYYYYKIGFKEAINNNHPDVVNYLLRTDDNIEPEHSNNNALNVSIKNNYTKIARILLEDIRVIKKIKECDRFKDEYEHKDNLLGNICRRRGRSDNIDIFKIIWKFQSPVSYRNYVKCYLDANVRYHIDIVNFLVWNYENFTMKYIPEECDRCMFIIWFVKNMDIVHDVKDIIIDNLLKFEN